MTFEAMLAAAQLADDGIDAEVIDVATLAPIDSATIVRSVEKTGRAVIAEEAPLTGGFGGEIAARLARRALTSLLAPVYRVAGYDCVMPLARLEGSYLPSADEIAKTAREAMSYT
jgi:2-oxoisovalerate dehydrogenase E1 component beta subunit